MKKIVLIVVGLAVALPPSAAAVKPTKYERQLARIECLQERGADPASRAEFRATYPGKKPLRVCIRIKAWELAQERAVASSEARIACQEERASDPVGFREEYPGGIKQCIRLESMP